MAALSQQQRAIRLYYNMLKTSRSWYIDRSEWRSHAVALRAKFDANKTVKDKRRVEALLQAGEAEFEYKKHPDPYRPSTALDGTKWERNIPPPAWLCKMSKDEEAWFNDKANWA